MSESDYRNNFLFVSLFSHCFIQAYIPGVTIDWRCTRSGCKCSHPLELKSMRRKSGSVFRKITWKEWTLKKNEDKTTEAAGQDIIKPGIIPGICPVIEKTCIATMNTVGFESSSTPAMPKIPGGIWWRGDENPYGHWKRQTSLQRNGGLSSITCGNPAVSVILPSWTRAS